MGPLVPPGEAIKQRVGLPVVAQSESLVSAVAGHCLRIVLAVAEWTVSFSGPAECGKMTNSKEKYLSCTRPGHGGATASALWNVPAQLSSAPIDSVVMTLAAVLRPSFLVAARSREGASTHR